MFLFESPEFSLLASAYIDMSIYHESSVKILQNQVVLQNKKSNSHNVLIWISRVFFACLRTYQYVEMDENHLRCYLESDH